MQINLIWAQAKDRVIGKAGTMPWHLPEDLAHFKRNTQGGPVIMGRKTWDSLPARFRPLPGRTNVVISADLVTRENLRKIGAEPASNLPEALLICEQHQAREVWVIGGAQIYAQALPLAHKLVVTEIDATFAGDAYAPVIPTEWREQSRQNLLSAQGLPLSFVTYLRTPSV